MAKLIAALFLTVMGDYPRLLQRYSHTYDLCSISKIELLFKKTVLRNGKILKTGNQGFEIQQEGPRGPLT